MSEQAAQPSYFGRDLEAMSFAQNYHQWICDELSPYLGNEVAEVGAGVGSFTELLIKHAQHVDAFEPSENMYPALADAYQGNDQINTYNGFFGGADTSRVNHYDSVVYVNVLEHVEDDDAELRSMYEALKPGGHVAIFVPALQWLYSDFDHKIGHFRRYHKADLLEKAGGAGFAIKRCHYFDAAGILPWYLAMVLLKRDLAGGSVSLYDRLVVPVTRFVEGLITPPLGKNLLLIGQKPESNR